MKLIREMFQIVKCVARIPTYYPTPESANRCIFEHMPSFEWNLSIGRRKATNIRSLIVRAGKRATPTKTVKSVAYGISILPLFD